MGFIKETSSTRWDNQRNTAWENLSLKWNDGWTPELFIEINTYSYLTSTWSGTTNTWKSLT